MQKNTIWVVPKNDKILNFVVKALGDEYDIVMPSLENRTKTSPFYMFGSCDYLCRFDVCFSTFFLANRFPATPFALVRPVLLPARVPQGSEFWIVWIRQSKEDERLKNTIDRLGFLPYEYIYSLSLQKKIIENRGRIFHVSRLAEYLKKKAIQSTKFKKECGMALNTYMKKIRLCHALFDLVSSDDCVKTIAFNYGYHPFAFSRVFHKNFDVWPSSIRAKKLDFLLWLLAKE